MDKCPNCGENLLPITRNGVKQIVCSGECGYRTTVDELASELESALALLIPEFADLLAEVEADLRELAAAQ